MVNVPTEGASSSWFLTLNVTDLVDAFSPSVNLTVLVTDLLESVKLLAEKVSVN